MADDIQTDTLLGHVWAVLEWLREDVNDGNYGDATLGSWADVVALNDDADDYIIDTMPDDLVALTMDGDFEAADFRFEDVLDRIDGLLKREPLRQAADGEMPLLILSPVEVLRRLLNLPLKADR